VAEFVAHETCPECGSKDNLARYSDNSAHCFGCKYNEMGSESMSEATRSPSKPVKQGKLEDLEYRRLAKRGITEDTCRHFGYKVGTLGNKTVQVAEYRKGKKIGYKTRDSNKKFTWTGDTKNMGLFGQHLWRDGGKKVVVTEGEIDAMTVSQLQNNKWPVVSVPNGAASAAKDCGKEIEWLESFEQVVFMFDMDEAGQDGARAAAEMLSPGKSFIARLPLKDANELLLAGRGKDVIDAMWSAKAYRPDGVIDVSDVVDDAAADIQVGLPWPWATLTEKTYGRRRGELYGFGGGTGCGKSTVFKQIAKHIIEVDNLPVGLLMLEEPPKLTAKTMAGMMMGKRVHVPGVEYDREELRSTLEGLGGRIFLYDHFGSMSFEVIREKIRYMVRALGIRDIFLDHLTALAASIELDERKAIDAIMADLSSLTQELDCTIYYVSHLTTPEGKAHEEGGRVLEKQFRGSRSIAYWSHFLFGIERDKQADNGVTVFRVLKDRYTGDSAGVRFGLEYSRETGLLNECPLPTKEPANSGFVKEDDGEY
jgi:twinkle protein